MAAEKLIFSIGTALRRACVLSDKQSKNFKDRYSRISPYLSDRYVSPQVR